jgi:hypothetical protein
MKPAEFEEREYEAPLYNQLATPSGRVWAPGQVFEGHVGFDYGLFMEDPWLFRMHGRRRMLRGAALARYPWPEEWFRRRTPRHLPDFRLNLFVQAKRPMWGKRAPAKIRAKGIPGLFWRIELNPEQQETLEVVADRLGSRALVVYAAPTFHEHKDLFRHTTLGTIPNHSTFPSAIGLRGHTHWYYSSPGASGVANPDPVRIQEPTLDQRIGALLELAGQFGDQDWRGSLKGLSRDLRDALLQDRQAEGSRRAIFFDLVRQIENETREVRDPELWEAYLTVSAFCEVYVLDWYVVGDAQPRS